MELCAPVERELAAHIAVAQALVAWNGVESWFARLLANLAGPLDCQAGVLWVPRGDRLAPRTFWHAEAEDLGQFKVMTVTSRLLRGMEMPGHVWQELEPSSRTLDTGLAPPRWRAATAAGFRAAIGFPAVWADDLVAVIELVSREEAELTARLKRSLAAIGYVLGFFLARHRGTLDGKVLTDRQVQVLKLSAQGLSVSQIADRLGVRPSTVRTHFENIYDRLGVQHKAAAAVAEAIRLGLVD